MGSDGWSQSVNTRVMWTHNIATTTQDNTQIHCWVLSIEISWAARVTGICWYGVSQNSKTGPWFISSPMGVEWLKLLYLAQALSLQTSGENIWDFNKKSSRSGSKYDSQTDLRYSFNNYQQRVVKVGWLHIWIVLTLTTIRRKTLTRQSCFVINQVSSNSAKLYRRRSRIVGWSWLLRWRPVSFQSWYQSHDRTSQG